MSSTKGFPPRSDGSHLPPSMRDLPRFAFTTKPATTREQVERGDTIYGVKSLGEAITRANESFPGLRSSPAAKRGD